MEGGAAAFVVVLAAGFGEDVDGFTDELRGALVVGVAAPDGVAVVGVAEGLSVGVGLLVGVNAPLPSAGASVVADGVLVEAVASTSGDDEQAASPPRARVRITHAEPAWGLIRRPRPDR